MRSSWKPRRYRTRYDPSPASENAGVCATLPSGAVCSTAACPSSYRSSSRTVALAPTPDVQRFLGGRETEFGDPFRMPGFEDALRLLREAVRSRRLISVYGDFDVDGITSTAILTETLRDLGGEAMPYIPHREREGYGLNVRAIDSLADRGVEVLVTCDCGTTANPEVEHARRPGYGGDRRRPPHRRRRPCRRPAPCSTPSCRTARAMQTSQPPVSRSAWPTPSTSPKDATSRSRATRSWRRWAPSRTWCRCWVKTGSWCAAAWRRLRRRSVRACGR